MDSRIWQKDGKTKIKICGIKNIEFAYDCYDLGVSALGYHLWRPKNGDGINQDRIKEYSKIITMLPKEITSVLVTTCSELSQLTAIQQQCQFDTIQLHLQLAEDELVEIANAMNQRFNSKIMS